MRWGSIEVIPEFLLVTKVKFEFLPKPKVPEGAWPRRPWAGVRVCKRVCAPLIILFHAHLSKCDSNFLPLRKHCPTSPGRAPIPYLSPNRFISISDIYFHYWYVPSSLSHPFTDPPPQEAQNAVISTGNHAGFHHLSRKQNLKNPPSPPHHVPGSQSTEQFLQSRKQ